MTDQQNLEKRFLQAVAKLDLKKKEKEIKTLEKKIGESDFWQNQEEAVKKTKRLNSLQKRIQQVEKISQLIKEERVVEAESELKALETLLYFSSRYDRLPAILAIHSGQGGVEAMDWAQMLQRMYIKLFEKKEWPYQILEENFGEEAGVKKVVLAVDQDFAYGWLKYEAGTHRLVRLSPFNADHLRQTSFALVEVLPQLEDDKEAEVKEDDLSWQFFRSSTQGGQNVQKVSTAVRLLHQPSGIVVTCQTQRYQQQNRKLALKLLQAKLWEKSQKSLKKEVKKLKKGRTQAAWGTQIRSYVLAPYRLVKDLRTSFETEAVESVLDGGLEEFLEEEIRFFAGSGR
ncbi:PCRF domain-containing protein [Patescibacteria group bacterium]